MSDVRGHLAGQVEMLAVRTRRRYRLCQILTVIGVLFLSVFGGLRVVNGPYVLGVLLLTNAALGLVNLYILKRSGNVERAAGILSCILFVLSISLLVTGGEHNTGLLWVYPIAAINLFINRFLPAVFIFSLFSITSGLLLFTPLSSLLMTSYSPTEAIRFVITMLALNSICLAALRSEEKAYETIMALHEDDIRQLAYYDTLTSLPNRWSFKTNLEQMLKSADKEKRQLGLLYIDLDNFKQVNDQYGHEAGDQLLVKFSERLTQVIHRDETSLQGQTESLARLAGDEFVVLLPNIKSADDASETAAQILDIFKERFRVADIEHMIYASIGIAIYPDSATDAEDLLHQADAAMYSAKHSGRNCYRFFTQALSESQRERQLIENGLKIALQKKQFSLAYMPIFDCKDNSISAVEVLLRCHTSELKNYGPDQFIPVAESTGLIKEIDLWVIDNALKSLNSLTKQYRFNGSICINISGVELHNNAFPAQVRALLHRHEVNPKRVDFEITETSLVTGDTDCLNTLNRLTELGISLSLDDFGTGYTAFSQLIHYPADYLKIDRSFVNDLFSETKSRSKMVMIILNLAKLHGLRVIAEGVETKEQLDYLRDLGCDYAQGYYLSKPLQWHKFIEHLKG